MLARFMLVLLLLIAWASGVWAQTRITAEIKCGKAGDAYAVPVGDRPDHEFRIGKNKCISVKPLVIDGVSSVSEEVTYFAEITGDKSRARSYGNLAMSNGDKCYLSHQANEVVKNGVFQQSDVTWTMSRCTGKLSGLSAKGTAKCKGEADGSVVCLVEGEYPLKK